jgi:copper oxidase (laccase) domain-containing protein
MATKKTADLSASLVAVKGSATAAADAAGRQPEVPPTAVSPSVAPLNFKVDAEFRRRFRQRAAEADLKLNQLLREALDAWEERRGKPGS